MKKAMMILAVLFAGTLAIATLPGFSEIKGTTTNYTIKDGDGWIDFALVLPAMNSEELINFDLAKIISPESDEIKVLGQSAKVPSNLSVPKQKESYFLSFTVDKNQFRSYLPDQGMYNLYALRGRFPVSDVVKGVQAKKSVFELINFFEFEGGGTKGVKSGSTNNVSIAVNSITLDKEYSVKAPTYGASKVMLALSMFKSNGEFYPTDLKRIVSGKSEKLKTRGASSSQFTLSVLMNQSTRSFEDGYLMSEGDIAAGIFGVDPSRAPVDAYQLSYTLQKSTSTTTPKFLAQIAAPKFSKSSAKLSAKAPASVSGVEPYATYIVLSQVEQTGSGDLPVEFRRVLWTQTVMGWQNDFSIPSSAINLIKNKAYAWDVMYLGAGGKHADTEINWDNVTHNTRNSLSF